MNFAKFENSIRLQRALSVLQKSPGGLTSREWIRQADIVGVSAIASELREYLRPKGWNVKCEYERTTQNGCRVNRYRLVRMTQAVPE
jgi:hypothetical protein